MIRRSSNPLFVYSRLLTVALPSACTGGTNDELERILSEDRARQAEREAIAVADTTDRQIFETASRDVLAAHLGMELADAQYWSVVVTVGARAAGLTDPKTGLCAVVVQHPDVLEVYSVGRPIKIPDGDLLRTVRGGTYGDLVEADLAHKELSLWASQTCGAASSDSTGLPDR